MSASKSVESDGVFPFSIIYRELKDILASSCDSIFILAQDRASRCANISSNYSCGPWIKDNNLHTKLIALKGWADVVSKSCTKLTIIVSKVPAVENVKCILREMCGQITSFVGSYM